MASRRMSRTLMVVAGAAAIFGASVAPVLADSPANDHHPDSNVEAVLTPGERAAFSAKHRLARASARFAATGSWARVPARALRPLYVCEFDCAEGPPSPPVNSRTLDTRARRQINYYYCGPASGQAVINFTRGYFYNDINGGQSTSTNWRTQTEVAGLMGTTEQLGTLGWQIREGLNDPEGVKRPAPDWTYAYEQAADGAEFHSWIVEDVGRWGMPVLPDLKPHQEGATYYLPSWSVASPGSKHWVAIRGYVGLWDGTNGPTIKYSESAGWNGDEAQPGNWVVGAKTMWKVTQALYGKAVW